MDMKMLAQPSSTRAYVVLEDLNFSSIDLSAIDLIRHKPLNLRMSLAICIFFELRRPLIAYSNSQRGITVMTKSE